MAFVRSLMVDARSAQTGGGVTVLDVVEGHLAAELPGWTMDVRTRGALTHPVIPLVVGGGKASAVLGMSESSNVGWPSVPYVMLARNWHCWQAERSVPAFARRGIALRNARRASMVVVATEVFADVVHAQVPSAEVSVVPFGVRKEFSHVGDGVQGSYLLSVGDIYRHKRLDLAIEGFSRSGLSADYKLRIAGSAIDSTVYAELQRQVDTLGLIGRVDFMGRVGADNLPGLYRGAAATLLTSDLESFGHPYVEAMACGCPIVGRKSAVSNEVTSGAATLVGPDPDEIAGALVEVISTDRQTAAAAGLVRSKAFDWSIWCRALADMIEGLT